MTKNSGEVMMKQEEEKNITLILEIAKSKDMFILAMGSGTVAFIMCRYIYEIYSASFRTLGMNIEACDPLPSMLKAVSIPGQIFIGIMMLVCIINWVGCYVLDRLTKQKKPEEQKETE